MPRLAQGLRALCVCTLVVATASAQPAGNVQLDPFRPAVDARGYLTVNGSQLLGHGELSFGLGSLAWGHELLRLSGAGGATYSVDDMITATLVGAVGLKLGPVRLQLGASLPLSIMAGDRGPDDLGDPSTTTDDRNFQLDGQGLGSVGIHAKLGLLSSSRRSHLGITLLASLYLPSATKDAFLGEPALTPQLLGIVEKEFGRLRLAINAGIRVRRTAEFTDVGAGGAPATNGTLRASSELPVGLGIAYAIAPQKFDVVGEVFGAVPLGAHTNYQPAEAVGGVKLYLARNSFLSLGAGRGLATSKGASPDVRAFIGIVFEPNLGDRDGDGIKDDRDRCPDDPEDRDGFEDEDGCPDPDNDRDLILDDDDKCPLIPEDRDGVDDEDGCPEGSRNDRDDDGIFDNDDACPDEPEDFDNFEDSDGCPDLDNDRDRILDVDDLCPDSPEDYDNFEDEDGCPDLDNDRDLILDVDDKCPNEKETYNNIDDKDGCPDEERGVIKLRKSEIITMKPINFELDSDVIDKGSYYILDAVVATMVGNPDIALIEVAGHTDEQGSDAHNLDLSQRRAASVVRYLTEHGVAADRLESQGYGETIPKVTGRTQAAYAINRRVEFVILKRDL